MRNKTWFYQHGYIHAQFKAAGSTFEAEQSHNEFMMRIMDTPRDQRIQALEDYKAGQDQFNHDTKGNDHEHN